MSGSHPTPGVPAEQTSAIERVRPRRRRRKRWLLGLAAVLAMIAGAVAMALPRWTVRAIVSAPNKGKSPPELSSGDVEPEGVDALRLSVGPPDASIAIWITGPAAGPTTSPSRGTIIVLHGMGDSKRSMLSVGYMLAAHGHRVILVDHRGQGSSTGEWLTYGVQESRDLSQILNQLEAMHRVDGPIGVFGASYGAATAIQWAARDPRVRAVVAVAAFARMTDVVPISVRYYLPGGSLLTANWLDTVVRSSARMAGFDPADASPISAIGRTNARVLLIHGLLDARIPADQSRQLAAVAPERTRLILLEHEDHDSIMSDSTGTISREVPKWFEGMTIEP